MAPQNTEKQGTNIVQKQIAKQDSGTTEVKKQDLNKTDTTIVKNVENNTTTVQKAADFQIKKEVSNYLNSTDGKKLIETTVQIPKTTLGQNEIILISGSMGLIMGIIGGLIIYLIISKLFPEEKTTTVIQQRPQYNTPPNLKNIQPVIINPCKSEVNLENFVKLVIEKHIRDKREIKAQSFEQTETPQTIQYQEPKEEVIYDKEITVTPKDKIFLQCLIEATKNSTTVSVKSLNENCGTNYTRDDAIAILQKINILGKKEKITSLMDGNFANVRFIRDDIAKIEFNPSCIEDLKKLV